MELWTADWKVCYLVASMDAMMVGQMVDLMAVCLEFSSADLRACCLVASMVENSVA